MRPATALADAPQHDPHQQEDVEHTIIVGVGGAAELELADGSLHPGANVFVEWDAIEHWLELELGVSALRAVGSLQIPVDLLFKKPFRLSRHVEFMIGLGPEIVTTVSGPANGTRFGGEVALDFMFWPWHRVGLWVEPTYDFVFQDGVSHGIGSTGGVMVGW